MGETDSKKQFLSLIRNFSTQKSQGEQRIISLKNKTEELKNKLESANYELEEAKSLKETTERDFKGFEVEFSMTQASIQALLARVSLIHEEISVSSSNLEALKSEEGARRDEFINRMCKLNDDIRKFQAETALDFSAGDCVDTSTKDGLEIVQTGPEVLCAEAAEAKITSIEQKIAEIITETSSVEKEYQEAQIIHKQAQEELAALQRKLFLMESIMNESLALEDLTRQTSQHEEMCASLGKELQRSCVCPSCHLDNVEALGGILHAGA